MEKNENKDMIHYWMTLDYQSFWPSLKKEEQEELVKQIKLKHEKIWSLPEKSMEEIMNMQINEIWEEIKKSEYHSRYIRLMVAENNDKTVMDKEINLVEGYIIEEISLLYMSLLKNSVHHNAEVSRELINYRYRIPEEDCVNIKFLMRLLVIDLKRFKETLSDTIYTELLSASLNFLLIPYFGKIMLSDIFYYVTKVYTPVSDFQRREKNLIISLSDQFKLFMTYNTPSFNNLELYLKNLDTAGLIYFDQQPAMIVENLKKFRIVYNKVEKNMLDSGNSDDFLLYKSIMVFDYFACLPEADRLSKVTDLSKRYFDRLSSYDMFIIITRLFLPGALKNLPGSEYLLEDVNIIEKKFLIPYFLKHIIVEKMIAENLNLKGYSAALIIIPYVKLLKLKFSLFFKELDDGRGAIEKKFEIFLNDLYVDSLINEDQLIRGKEFVTKENFYYYEDKKHG
jgi:hypothetical protein